MSKCDIGGQIFVTSFMKAPKIEGIQEYIGIKEANTDSERNGNEMYLILTFQHFI